MRWLMVRFAGLALSLMDPMRQAERRRDSTLLAGGGPTWAGGPVKCEDFLHCQEEAPGTPLIRPSSGAF
ncbi:unnamed protein product [Echinostoma caproni]|uniref:Secreted protein n=1 Tax=Echinostoma caproni TaxID=27848 RepID=A0A183B9G2_9TREM|nr:unnamed protein product [Echinostoma caproni]